MAEGTHQDPGPFSEYKYFEPPEGDEAAKAARNEQNAQFQAGRVTNPNFDYPKLNEDELTNKRQVYEDAVASAPEDQRTLMEARRKGVDIAVAALGLKEAGKTEDHTARWHSGQELVEASQSRYGELKPALFWPVLAGRLAVVQNFKPGNMHAEMTKGNVLSHTGQIPEDAPVQNEILDQELLDRISPAVMEYLAPILAAVPEEGDYNSAEIADFAQSALENMGLAEDGWTPFRNAAVSTFSVESKKKRVIIPDPPPEEGVEWKKSAGDIRRLFAHEIGIHAMRRDKSLGQDFEEGMGLLMECVVTNSTDGVAIQRAENRYLHAGLAAGIDGTPRNARQVFELTWRMEAMALSKDGIITPKIEAKAKKAVQPHIDNIFRGTDHKLPGIAYSRAKVYLEGIIEAAAYARTHADEEHWLLALVKNGPS